jgi:hypothetical protein
MQYYPFQNSPKHDKLYISEAVPKCQILELQPMKTAVLQPVGRKTARAGYKITNFGTGTSNHYKE